MLKGGNLDIDVIIRNPSGRVVSVKLRIQQSSGDTYYPDKEGDFEICFSNEFSRVTSKMIMIDIDVIPNDDDGGGGGRGQYDYDDDDNLNQFERGIRGDDNFPKQEFKLISVTQLCILIKSY